MRYRKSTITLAACLMAMLLSLNMTACSGLEEHSVSASMAESSLPTASVLSEVEPPTSSEDTVTSRASLPESSEATSSLPTSSSGTGLPLSSITGLISSANESAKPPVSSAVPSSQPVSSVPVSSVPVSSVPVSSVPSSALPEDPPRWEGSATTAGMKAVWLSYLEFQAFAGSDESTYTDKITTILDRIADKGLDTVIVQVRPYGDSFYPSDYYPWSKCISGSVDVDPGYDPLEIVVEEGHARGLAVHAWINPYRVMTDAEFDAVSDDWPVKKWYNSSNRKKYMLQMSDGRWWLQPGNREVQQLIQNGVKEILSGYDVDGIHMDDYFYNVEPSKYGDTKSEAQQNTTDLVKALYSITKAYGGEKLFGISPMGSFREAADLPASDTGAHSTDLALWCSRPGYIDYVMPQIYWEYDHATQPFLMTLQKWEDLVTEDSVALYIGLAPYRLSADEIEQQILDIEMSSRASGYCLFRYDHIHNLVLN